MIGGKKNLGKEKTTIEDHDILLEKVLKIDFQQPTAVHETKNKKGEKYNNALFSSAIPGIYLYGGMDISQDTVSSRRELGGVRVLVASERFQLAEAVKSGEITKTLENMSYKAVESNLGVSKNHVYPKESLYQFTRDM